MSEREILIIATVSDQHIRDFCGRGGCQLFDPDKLECLSNRIGPTLLTPTTPDGLEPGVRQPVLAVLFKHCPYAVVVGTSGEMRLVKNRTGFYAFSESSLLK